MAAPFNAPDDPARQPTMDGFVTDYINAFYAETGRLAAVRRIRADHGLLHARADARLLDARQGVCLLRSLVL